MFCLKTKNSGLLAKKEVKNNKMKRSIFFSLFAILYFISVAQIDSGTYFKSFDGTKIYYEVKGNGEPILLVHGFYSKWTIMEAN